MREFERSGLIYIDEVRAAGDDPRAVRMARSRGELVRVRRGVYSDREQWDSLDATQQHVVQVRAVVRATHPPFVVAGRSAAALWGMPFAASWPIDVTLLVPYTGGGKSEPGVRRTSAGGRNVQPVTLDGIPVTSLARTALDVARSLDFPDAVAVLDRALSLKNPLRVQRAELELEFERAGFVRGAAALARAIEFATECSGSVGESRARAVIHRLGFEAPVLQTRFVDAEVLWREKKREDRLRKQVSGIVRILHEHVQNPRVLERMLVEAGIPRR